MLVELHSNAGDFGYFAEASARTNFYDFQGYPSLFRDGVDIWTAYSPEDWRDSIEARMALPSPVTLTITGSYDPAANTGTINAAYRNDSSASITARIYFVITEDSLYNLDPNGHAWHNHLARDFLPDQTGEQVTITSGATVTRSRNFTISTSWNENRCRVVTWLQADAPSRNGYQSGDRKIMDMVGVEEITPVKVDQPNIKLGSNPCTDIAKFSLHSPAKTDYRIDIFDAIGRKVRQINGTTEKGAASINWDLRDAQGNRVDTGVYFYKCQTSELNSTGKIIVQ